MACGQNSVRRTLLVICILQIISTTERQVFDFLGFMWIPILTNFLNIIFVILGFFGTYQYKTKYVICYLIWMWLWVAWNVFVICFYHNVGFLDNRTDWLNLGTGSATWWEIHGYGCQPVYPTNFTHLDPLRPIRPDVVHGCLVDYQNVETIHAGIQCIFGVLGIVVSIYLIQVYSTTDEPCKYKHKPTSIYSVEYRYSPQREGSESPEPSLEEGPCRQSSTTTTTTPRRVKRQSRNRLSGRSQERASTSHDCQRSRRHFQNPVTQIMDRANESSTSTDSYRLHPPPPPPPASRFRGTAGRHGHSNPMYVHSRPNSSYSLQESVERPPSVHSSYSNYHPQRPSLNPQPFPRTTKRLAAAAPAADSAQAKQAAAAEIRTVAYSHCRSLATAGSSVSINGSLRDCPPPYSVRASSETNI